VWCAVDLKPAQCKPAAHGSLHLGGIEDIRVPRRAGVHQAKQSFFARYVAIPILSANINGRFAGRTDREFSELPFVVAGEEDIMACERKALSLCQQAPRNGR
jgi:hypothetical protein